ncbi:MAG: Holliday junction branch migration DNA helicase RuvB [Candidatus Aminicenantes bacterium]|nr:Holliday junction branch migration DNA helicase RuvB [Candidatus Aminicenantes bacterium]MCK5004071.1 Holliday junction branch migration DNA helicase RuvB [Candidatus Aminicenantes bacterium]
MNNMNNPVNEKEGNLRPSLINDFIGQERNLSNLVTYIKGAQNREEVLDHVLLSGPPGLGKTTLANIIAIEMNVNIKHTSGPVLDKKGDLTAILTDLDKGDVLFIDEIHRLRTNLEEILYKAMEDFQIDVIIGQGIGAKNISLDLNRFTLVGATTRSGLLSSPMRDRFGIPIHLNFYSADELSEIVLRSSEILNIKITGESCNEIARRSRGTPRIANKLLRRIRDFAEVKGEGEINKDIVKLSFKALEIDEEGFDKNDRKILTTIIEKFDGGPVGLTTIATAVGEEKETIEDVYEPYLVQMGFLKITPRGRVVTDNCYRHLNINLKEKDKTLFD